MNSHPFPQRYTRLMALLALLALSGCKSTTGEDLTDEEHRPVPGKQNTAAFLVSSTREQCGANICFVGPNGRPSPELPPLRFHFNQNASDTLTFAMQQGQYCFRIVMFDKVEDFKLHGLKQGQSLRHPEKDQWPLKHCPKGKRCPRDTADPSPFVKNGQRVYFDNLSDQQWEADPKGPLIDTDKRVIDYDYKVEAVSKDANGQCPVDKAPEFISDDPRIRFIRV